MSAQVLQRFEGIQVSDNARVHDGNIYGDVTNTEVHYHNTSRSKYSERVRRISDALFLTSPELDRAEIISAKGRRVSGTCEWIQSSSDFQAWLAGDQRILWIRGGPGTGKTILSTYISEELERKFSASGQAKFLYLFCHHEKCNTATHVLRSILWQFLSSQHELAEVLYDWFTPSDRATYSITSRDALWLMLVKVLKVCEPKNVYCLLDGLDELDGDSAEWLTDKLAQLSSSEKDHGNKSGGLRILVASRELAGLKILPHMHISIGTGASRDLETYVSVRIQEISQRLQGVPDDLKNGLHAELLSRAAGTFLWIGFALYELHKLGTWTELLRTLESLPRGLPAYYERMLLQVQDCHVTQAARILRWVAFAARPLALHELATALDINDTPLLSKQLAICDQIAFCGPMLRIHGDKVVIVHLSAREFLVDTLATSTNAKLCAFNANRVDTHMELFASCMQCIHHATTSLSKTRLYKKRERNRKAYRLARTKMVQDHPLLSYSVVNWQVHAAAISAQSADSIMRSSFFLQEDHAVRNIWADIYFDLVPERNADSHTDLLCLACACGLLFWVKILIDMKLEEAESAVTGLQDPSIEQAQSECVHEPNPNMKAPKAVTFAEDPSPMHRHRREILGSSSDQFLHAWINDGDEEGNTPLEMAMSSGNEHVVKLLLDHGANSRGANNYNSCPLVVAIRRGQHPIVKLLLEYGADVNWTPRTSAHTWSSLHAAVSGGDVNIVRTLLEHKPGIFKLSRGQTPLTKAIKKDRSEIVAVLVTDALERLEISADPLLELEQHLRSDHLDIVNIFLNSNTQIREDKDRIRKSWIRLLRLSYWPFGTAMGRRVIKFFLAHNDGILDISHNGKTLLHACDDIETLEFLLGHGVNLEAKDDKGWTPLHSASSNDRHVVVEFLLSKGTNVQIQDLKGRTPLHLCNCRATANFLLSHGADINARDRSGRTRLHSRKRYPYRGDDDLFMGLVERGACVSIEDFEGRTPLHRVAGTYPHRVFSDGTKVNTLIKFGANINAQDIEGRTALHYSVASLVRNGHLWQDSAFTELEILLKAGADANISDKTLNTPLHKLAMIPKTSLLNGEDSWFESDSDTNDLLLDGEDSCPESGSETNDLLLDGEDSCPESGSETIDISSPGTDTRQDESPNTPVTDDVSIASGFLRGFGLVKDLLVTHGANIALRNADGKTPEELKNESAKTLQEFAHRPRNGHSWSNSFNADHFWCNVPGGDTEHEFFSTSEGSNIVEEDMTSESSGIEDEYACSGSEGSRDDDDGNEGYYHDNEDSSSQESIQAYPTSDSGIDGSDGGVPIAQ